MLGQLDDCDVPAKKCVRRTGFKLDGDRVQVSMAGFRKYEFKTRSLARILVSGNETMVANPHMQERERCVGGNCLSKKMPYP